MPWSNTSAKSWIYFETKEKEKARWMCTWVIMLSLSRSYLDAMSWPAHWRRSPGKFIIIVEVIISFEYHIASFLTCSNVSFQMVCSKRMPFSCQNLCGNLLPCSNHYCTRPCHVLKLPKHEEKAIIQQQEPFILPLNVEGERAGSCEVCFLPCQKVSLIFCFRKANISW